MQGEESDEDVGAEDDGGDDSEFEGLGAGSSSSEDEEESDVDDESEDERPKKKSKTVRAPCCAMLSGPGLYPFGFGVWDRNSNDAGHSSRHLGGGAWQPKWLGEGTPRPWLKMHYPVHRLPLRRSRP